jgi:hypothetical protein
MKGINVLKYKYKVVKKRNNRSCMVNGNSQFSLVYEKDENTYAPAGTLGIMVFKTRRAAEHWAIDWYYKFEYAPWDTPWKIKRVIPIGKGKTPVEVCSSATSKDLKDFYYSKYHYYLIKYAEKLYVNEPVPGTICYPAVFVVD